ncbi:hypothetical protein [Aurantiacibacter sp. D1-12]|uniref:hypothetical protein n=1 Tax=Aurantiacibacter sp. D1-12 TaxID=2993658 RepID=UPI00237C6F2A|nr:hypothetical protein [Aurantiacibacter sp. D1-12]MDE1466745.1 hypothetical protein [Aurantiacibacter sp. D1-12]
MKTFAITAAVAALTIGSAANANAPKLYEEQLAMEEEARILQQPIAGIYNSFWFDYRINVVETQEELYSDLRRASDIEDMRDAWEEYAHELRDNRMDYTREMAERGYRATVTGTVTFED